MNSGETPLFSASQAELISFTSFFAGRKGELIYRDLQELSLKASSLARSLLKDGTYYYYFYYYYFYYYYY
jgi:hypothetical protein